MESVYDWTGFGEAFEYLKNEKKKNVLIENGQRLIDELSRVSSRVNDLVSELMKKLECSFDQKFIIGIKSLCKFG
jgi:hypothetical protein